MSGVPGRNNLNPETGRVYDENGNIVDILKVLSFSDDAIKLTTYEDDYIIRGNAFNNSSVLTLTSSQTVTFLLDMSNIGENIGIFATPIKFSSSDTEVRVKIYEDTNYTGGTPVNYYNVNRIVPDTHDFIVTVGATGANKGTLLREHAAFASASGNNNTSSQGGGSKPTILNTSKKYLIEIVNVENSATNLEYDTTIYEIPFTA